MNKLQYISWINKNSVFDKSLGKFEEIDFFIFLENLSSFDYSDTTIYDDFYYILEYTNDTILHLINNINKEIKRKHEIMTISKAREFDKESILWISKKPGRSIKEKLKENKIKALKRFDNIDTYENRILKKFLKIILFESENRDDLDKFEKLFTKIREFLRSDIAKLIDERKRIVYNNILLHHKHYKKIFKAYKWLNNLDEKYKNITPNFNLVVKYETLFQLQFFTDKLILPDTLKIDYENLSLENKVPCVDCGSLEIDITLKFETLRKDLTTLIPYTTSKLFNTSYEEKNVFIDLFRTFPIAKIDEKIIEFPIMLKQKIDNKIINANNTKIIDLNKEFFTLSEILHSLDTTILRYFLKDLEKYFKNSAIFYILPDYINQFEFGEIKKTLNSYFKTKIIPKSILAGINYIFEDKVKENDTLIYIQKNYNNELFVTPLLVKYDKNLTITNGLYLEKHPTKKFENSDDVLNTLQNYFDETTSKKLLNKFLQNGIKKLSQQNIKFLKDNQIITIKNLEFNQKQIYNIKYLFNQNILFKENTIFIEDENTQNLTNYQKIIKFEKDGFVLWKEHLPKLAMQIIKNGYFDEFILVDEDSKITNKQVQIKQHFIIPANKKEISFPLIFGDESIDFEAYITSKEMPFDEDVECKLQLRYDYEAENPYELIFYPLDDKKPLQVKWREINYSNIKLDYPKYPPKKDINDFRKFGDKNVDLIDWLNKSFKYLTKLNQRLQNTEEIILTKNWQRDRNGYEYQMLDTSKGEVRFYKNNIDKIKQQPIKKINITLKRTGRFYRVDDFITDKEFMFLSKKFRFPLYNIFKDGIDINQFDNDFILNFQKAIQAGIDIIQNKEIRDLNLKNEIFFFLTFVNKYSPMLPTLITLIDKNIKKYRDNVGLSIGCLETNNQKKLFNKVFELIKLDDEESYSDGLKILGMALWRCESLIFEFSKANIEYILKKLYKSIELKFQTNDLYNTKKMVKKSIVMRFELLFGLIRFRQKEQILHPKEELTKKFIKLVDNLTKLIFEKNLTFISKIEFEIQKEQAFKDIPDLLYALRLYLSGDSGASSIKVIGVKDE